MALQQRQGAPSDGVCRAVVIWIDWYAYHLARFRGLQTAFGPNGEVRGIELVGGAGVHTGYSFREGVPNDLPVETLRPKESWQVASKTGLALALVKRLSTLDPEMVLVPGYYTLPAIAAALWCKAKGRVSVLMTETTAIDHVRKGWRETLKSRLIHFLFDWAVTGGAAHDRYLLQLGFPQNRIAHFYDVVGNTHIRDGIADLQANTSHENHGLPESYFLFVGRLAPEKNGIGLLNAWLAYRAAGGTWSLVFAGDGPDGESLKELAKDSPFTEYVRFLGHRSARELMPVYAFAKTFVLPSTREPWGLVVNEAMAAALPVIVSNRCGCAEDLVQHGDNGFIFTPENTEELTRCMTEMACSPEEERRRKGASSFQRIGRFSPQNFGLQIVAIADAAKGRAGGGDHIPREDQSRAQLFSRDAFESEQHTGDSASSRSMQCGDASQAWLQVLSHINPVYGGLSAVVPRLADQLCTQEEIATSIAAFCSPDEHLSAEQRENQSISTWPLGRSEWLLHPELRKNFRSRVAASDGVHIHGLWESSTLIAASAARLSGVPYILSAHGMLDSWALANKRLKKQIYASLFERRNTNRAICMHALTHAEATDYRKFGYTGPIAVIPNGVDAPASTDPSLFLKSHPEAEGKRLLLFLGRIHYKKGINLLLQGWSQVVCEHPDTLLVLAGPDSEDSLAGIRKTIQDLRLDERVLLTGMLDAEMKWSALAAADFFVLPSYSEGLSVAALEAMSMGVPLILSEQCNLPQIAEAKAGWQVKTNLADLVRVLQAALGCSPAVHSETGMQARSLAQREFSWTGVTERMAQLYRWVGGGPLPRNVKLLRGAL